MPLTYDQSPTVAPPTTSPNNTLSVQATPQAFGAQVGQAQQGLGQAAGQVGKEQLDIAIQRQQLLNEGYVADAETKLNSQYGDIDGWYKSLKGQAAMAAYPEAQKRVQQVRQQLLTTLPNLASQKAFNIVAARAEGFVLRDYGNHMGTEQKNFVIGSNAALRENLIDSASSYSAATDDHQIGYISGSVMDLNKKLVEDSGWDLNTPEGQAALKQENDKASGAIYTNVIKAIADDPDKGDVIKAVQYLNDNADHIPAATLARLRQELTPRYRDAMAKNGGDGILKGADDDYEKTISAPEKLTSPEKVSVGPSEGLLSPQDLHDKFRQQESGGTPSAQKTNPYQIQESTFNQYRSPDERYDRVQDRNAVAQRLLDGYNKQYHGDLARVAVAYFSGPGNVSPAGSATPYLKDVADKNGKTTSSYVQDITGGKQSPEGTASDQVYSPRAVPTKADFYERNRNTYIKKAEDWAEKNFPNDPRMRENVVQYTERHMQDTIRSQAETNDANSNAVGRFVLDPANNVTNTHILETAPQEVRDGWKYLKWAEPFKARSIENIITANNRQKHAPLTYGTDFYKHFSDFTDRLSTTNPAKDSDYWDYVGADRNSPLTTTGQGVLSKEIEYAKKGPEQAAFIHAERDFLDKMHNQIGTDPIGNQKFAQFIQNVMPKIQDARTHGLTVGQLFNENDKTNYIGKDAGQYVRTLEEFKRDAIRQHLNASEFGLAPTTPAPKFDVKTLEPIKDPKAGAAELQKRVQSKEITQQEALDYSHQRGWTIPRPKPQTAPAVK